MLKIILILKPFRLSIVIILPYIMKKVNCFWHCITYLLIKNLLVNKKITTVKTMITFLSHDCTPFFYSFDTLLLNLSNNNADTTPTPKQTIFIIACDKIAKLVIGIIIIVATTTIPTIA